MSLFLRVDKKDQMLYTKGINESDIEYQRFHRAITSNEHILIEVSSYRILTPEEADRWWK